MKKHTGIFIVLIVTLIASTTSFGQNKVVVVPLGGAGAQLATTTFTKNYTGGQYSAAFNGQEFFRNVGQYFRFNGQSNTTSVGLSTPLDLPQGAVLQSLSCYVDDQDAAIDFGFASSAALERRARNSTSNEQVLSSDLILTTTGSASGLEERTTSAIAHTTIDNDQYFYSMYVFFQVSTSMGGFVTPPFTASISFYGCSVTYELDVVTP